MGDIYVHVRMKECCRKTLAELDKHKKKAKFKGGVLGVKSLFDALSEKTIDDAKAAIPGGAGETGGKLEQLTRAACEKICEKHAGQHDGKGETEEGGFWHDLEAAIGGKPAKKRAGASGAGASGVGGKANGKALGGQGVADMAKAKAKEYKDNGVSYSMKEPFYPASKHSDCSHFVNDVLESSGVKADYVTTAGLPGSKQFTQVTDPQPGDIILQPGAPGHHGHMGVFTGINGSGKPLGVQMGEHGAKEVTWGEGGAIHGSAPVEYYRPVGG